MSSVRCVVARVYDDLLSCKRVKDYVLPDDICIEEYLDSYDYAELDIFCDENILPGVRMQIIELLCGGGEIVKHDGYIYKPLSDTDEKLQKIIFRGRESKLLDYQIQIGTIQSGNATGVIQGLLDQFSKYGLCASVFVEGNPEISVDISKCETISDAINNIAQELGLHWACKPQKKQNGEVCLAICLRECIGEDRTTVENCYRIKYDGKYTQTSTVSRIFASTGGSQVNVVVGSSGGLSSEAILPGSTKGVKCVEFDDGMTQEELDDATQEELKRCLGVDITLEIGVDKDLDLNIGDKVKVVIDNYKQNVNGEYEVTVIRTLIKYFGNERETKATVSNATSFLTREKILKNIFG